MTNWEILAYVVALFAGGSWMNLKGDYIFRWVGIAVVSVSLLLVGTQLNRAYAAQPTKAEFKEIRAIVKKIQSENVYMDDLVQFGKREWGQDIRITGKGDCEDWAIGYKTAILERFPHLEDSLRVMGVWHYDWRKRVNGAHAVLFVKYKNREYVVEGLMANPRTNGPKYMYSRIKLVRTTMYANNSRVVGELSYPTPKVGYFNNGKTSKWGKFNG